MATYTITFSAELSDADFIAMNKYFYEAMNEAMGITEVWGLNFVREPEEVEDTEND